MPVITLQQSRGSMLLRAVGKEEDIAAHLGVSRPLVNHWRNGRRKPQLDQRVPLRDSYGIPLEAWDEDPRPGIGPGIAKAGAPRDGTDMRPPIPRSLTDMELGELEGHEEEAVRLLVAEVRTSRSRLANPEGLARARAFRLAAEVDRGFLTLDQAGTITERARVLTALTNATREIGKLTGESRDLPESVLVRTPALQRIIQGTVEETSPWPEAQRALANYFQRLAVHDR